MEKVKVWDVAVRFFHWALAALVAVAFLTSEDDETIPWHVKAGIGIAALLVFRVIWGLAGPTHARFSSFVRGPREVLGYLAAYVRGRPPRHLGHNPLGGVMVVALLAILAGTAITGGLMYAGSAWDGPLSHLIDKRLGHGLEEVHEVLANSLLFLVPAHVLGVIVSSLLEKQNLVAAMITGKKRADSEGEAPTRAPLPRLFAAMVIAIALGWGLFQLLRPGVAEADVGSARALVASYDREARAADPAFAGFSAEAGRRLYETKGGRGSSCATCHGVDPRGPGRTPAGKNLEPLAPSVTATRFSDPGEAEKWFGRNCKQVLGRACTAREKGDFVTYVLEVK